MKAQLYNGLPIYEVFFEDGADIETIALVKSPANMRHFAAFEEKQARFSVLDEEQHVIFGLVMGAGQVIYRRDPDGQEYYAYFSDQSIKQLRERYMRDHSRAPLIAGHDLDKPCEGVFMLESFVKDSARGLSPKGYEDLAEGSWFSSYKIDNPEIWTMVKNGTFQGFSIHGHYMVRPASGLDVEPDLGAELSAIERDLQQLNF